MRTIPNWFVIAMALLVFVLLVLHTYENNLKSDYVTVLLLIILIIVPILPQIRLFRYRDMEFEVSEEQVDKIQKSGENIPNTQIENDPYINYYNTLYEMGLRYNPSASLLMLRTEFEKAIRSLYDIKYHRLSKREQRHRTESTRHMLKLLTEDLKVIDKEAAKAIEQYLMFFNRVAHGEQVTFEDEGNFGTTIGVGVRILRYLYSLLEEEIRKEKSS